LSFFACFNTWETHLLTFFRDPAFFAAFLEDRRVLGDFDFLCRRGDADFAFLAILILIGTEKK
jgi:hypothetical protein